MQTIRHLRELFRCNQWANARITDALARNECERARQILAHIVTTEAEWFDRLGGKDSTGFNFWPDLTVTDAGARANAIAARFQELLDACGESDLDRRVQYKNSRGERYEDKIRDILTHVLMHSAIHRGNIVIKLRESGFEPPATDYIIYLRETQGS